MDMQTVMGLVRAVFAFGGGWAASKGYISSDDVTTLTGAGLAVASAVWSIAHHSTANRAINETAGQITTPKDIKKKIIP